VPSPPTTSVWFWIAFVLFVLAMLALDLGVIHRRARRISFRAALGWCGFWVSLALVFNVFVYYWHGAGSALAFLTGYLLEYSLSVDNIFVFLLIFSYFQVPVQYQHRVLFWGILGALVLRASLIILGITLINLFHWVLYVFGAILIISGLRIAFAGEQKLDPGRNPILRFIRWLLPVTEEYHGNRFFVRIDGRLLATPLIVVLVFLELTDLIFALDSIPAIIGITRDSFIVFTSNVFAILGLRSLYFALAELVGMFRYLPFGLAVVLVFIGVKMCLEFLFEIPVGASLGVIAAVLAIAVIASILARRPTAADAN
jgi:tellurite resistance protein TerC